MVYLTYQDGLYTAKLRTGGEVYKFISGSVATVTEWLAANRHK